MPKIVIDSVVFRISEVPGAREQIAAVMIVLYTNDELRKYPAWQTASEPESGAQAKVRICVPQS